MAAQQEAYERHTSGMAAEQRAQAMISARIDVMRNELANEEQSRRWKGSLTHEFMEPCSVLAEHHVMAKKNVRYVVLTMLNCECVYS